MSCHALGTIGTRTVPKQLGEFPSSAEAWERRIQSGQAMTQMTTVIGRLDVPLAFKLFGDWTDRIAGGELPFAQPPRPQGIERRQWDFRLRIRRWAHSSPSEHLIPRLASFHASRRRPFELHTIRTGELQTGGTAMAGGLRSATPARWSGSIPVPIRHILRSPGSLRAAVPRPMDRAAEDIFDRNGVFWAPLASGQLASFDRRQVQGAQWRDGDG